jgi:hypothetical protein
MFSLLRPSLIYTGLSQDITEHDLNYDAEEWSYEGRDVFKGSADPNYTSLNVYWLYDDSLKRIGLVEHEINSPEVFRTLWIRERNPFATLFQDDEWKETGSTLWSLMSNEAYQDSLEKDFKNVFDDALRSKILLVTPEMLSKKENYIYECEKCGKQSFSALGCSTVMKKLDFNLYSLLFLDESFILFKAPSEFKWPVQFDACDQEPAAAATERADQSGLQDDLQSLQQQPETEAEAESRHGLHHPAPDHPDLQHSEQRRSPSSEHAQEETPEQPADAT